MPTTYSFIQLGQLNPNPWLTMTERFTSPSTSTSENSSGEQIQVPFNIGYTPDNLEVLALNFSNRDNLIDKWNQFKERLNTTSNTDYDFNTFFNTYQTIDFDNNATNTSLPWYSFTDRDKIKTYYPNFEGYNVAALENTPLYDTFSSQIVNGIKNKNIDCFKYLSWLLSKTQLANGSEGGEDANKIGGLLAKYWDFQNQTFKSGIDWNSDETKLDLDDLAFRYWTRRYDGKFGYYHLGPNGVTSEPEKPSTTETITTLNPTPTTPSSQITYQIPNLVKKNNYKYPGWSDWLPLSLQRLGDIVNNIKTTNWKKQLKFPLIEPKHHEYKITNGYAERQLIELQKAELRNAALQDRTSDLNANLKLRMAIEDKIDELNALQIKIKSDRFNTTSKEAQAVANQNTDWVTEASNKNRETLAAKWNSMLLANIEGSEKNNASRNSYIENMYGNYGDYIQKRRLNENARTAYLAKLDLLEKLYNNYKDYNELRTDPTKWKDIELFCAALMGDKLSNFEGDAVADQIRVALQNGIFSTLLSDPNVKQWIVSQLNDTNTESSVLKSWQNRYKVDLAAVKDITDLNARLANRDYYNILAGIDRFAMNQFGFPVRSKGSRSSVLMGKSGTKIDRLSRMLALILKESDSVRKQSTESQKRIQSNLNKSLDRLEKEELILLRAVFK